MKFSLIIPVAPGRNAEILESIKDLDFSKKQFEVIVKPGKNASENRNNGSREARGEFLVFLDDDAFIDKNYLNNLNEFLRKNQNVEIIGGPQLTPEEDKFFAKISGIALSSWFGGFKVNQRYESKKEKIGVNETAVTSANLVVKKSSFEKIGGFNLDLFPGEDSEFIQRAIKKGFKVAYSPKIVIYHKRRPSYNLFVKQMLKYGFTRAKVSRILRETRIIFLIPMFFSLYVIFLPILYLISFIFISPLIAYVLLCLIFSGIDSKKARNIAGFFLLPILYFTIHFSYGIGMVAGHLKRN